jgi:hypothetical protein
MPVNKPYNLGGIIMKFSVATIIALSVFLWMSSLFAQSYQTVSGRTVEKNTRKVVQGIPWQEASLSGLKEMAKSQNKMIFWVQLVGDLDGGL